ncbi:MAG: nucleotidyltransferase domain-containing protein [Ignavibacteriales bacterium]|nr:nucleotidyltransferase domain-containing protein [Ignavibacteriales bacterium]
MYTQEAVTKLIQQFVEIVSPVISIKSLYLFGSYATGTMREYSDIDVAVVSDDFQGIRFTDRQRINKLLIERTYPNYPFADLEVHPFTTEDFITDNPFVDEILRAGKRMI